MNLLSARISVKGVCKIERDARAALGESALSSDRLTRYLLLFRAEEKTIAQQFGRSGPRDSQNI